MNWRGGNTSGKLLAELRDELKQYSILKYNMTMLKIIIITNRYARQKKINYNILYILYNYFYLMNLYVFYFLSYAITPGATGG